MQTTPTGSVLFNLAVALAILTTVLALGLEVPLRTLGDRVRRPLPLLSVVGLNAVVIPAASLALARSFPISEAAAAGVSLAVVGSAGALGLKAAQLSRRSDLALALGLTVVLQVVNVVAVPVWANIMVPGGGVSPADVLVRLLSLVLAPLLVGQYLGRRFHRRVPATVAALNTAGTVFLVAALAIGIAVNWSTVIPLMGSGVLLLSLVILAGSMAGGASLRWSDPAQRTAVGLVSGTRFSALGLIVIGAELGNHADYLGPAIVYSLTELIVLTTVAVLLGLRTRAGSPTGPP